MFNFRDYYAIPLFSIYQPASEFNSDKTDVLDYEKSVVMWSPNNYYLPTLDISAAFLGLMGHQKKSVSTPQPARTGSDMLLPMSRLSHSNLP